MKMSVFRPIDLIREVKIRPGIYNKDALIPPRREHRQQLWLEVAENVTPTEEWENYTQAEREMRIGEVTNKWKNLRDHFYREIKLLDAGLTNKKRKYIYFDEMEFVRPYVGYKQPPLNKRGNKPIVSVNSTQLSQDNDDTDIDMEDFLKPIKKKTDDEYKPNLRRSKRSPVLKHTLKSRYSKPSSTPMANRPQKEIIKNFEAVEKSASSKNPTFKIRESDLSFCLSLVPTLRKMNEVRKLKVKIDILKVLHQNMDQIERESNARHQDSSNTNLDSDDDDMDDEFVGNVKVKPDPLNNRGNKSWW